MSSQKKSLAIVIPAFKEKFFDQALHSIASQTNQNFILYIGDDNSPDELYPIVEKYVAQVDIVYKKFEENLGSISVVEHWKRCLSMAKSEEWIWLFSDDDIMSKDCVELFYKAVQETSALYDVYRFNCFIINQVGNAITNNSQYPKIQTSYQFLISRLTYQYHSYIVNCIFSRNVYEKYNGFIDITAAWGSDDATWVLFGQEKGIYTLDNGLIKWRESSFNISGNKTNLVNQRRKYRGIEQFIEWIYKWAQQNKMKLDHKAVMNWYFVMLKSIGYNQRFWPYVKGAPFRKFFFSKSLIYQYKLLNQDFKIFK